METPFLSCAELKELFQPLSPNLAALQLSEGRLLGKLQIFSFGTFRCTLLETRDNQSSRDNTNSGKMQSARVRSPVGCAPPLGSTGATQPSNRFQVRAKDGQDELLQQAPRFLIRSNPKREAGLPERHNSPGVFRQRCPASRLAHYIVPHPARALFWRLQVGG